MSYLRQPGFGTRQTPQAERIPGRSDQVEDSAGGFVFAVDSLQRLRRFLVLGSESGSYYASERDLTLENVSAVSDALDEHGTRAVAVIVSVSQEGRAPKNDPALFALAMASGHSDIDVRKNALKALPLVARTGTHLFTFMEFAKQFRGRGRAFNAAVRGWYDDKDLDALAYQLVKYRQRGGWTHADVLRLVKPRPERGSDRDSLYAWATGKIVVDGPEGSALPGAVDAYVDAQTADSPGATAKLIREHGSVLPREALQPEHLNDPDVWRALLDVGMPLTAMLRNLATMTRHGVLDQFGSYTTMVTETLTDDEKLRKARVHPMAVLIALMTYSAGRSIRGDATWSPIPRVTDALDAAFYASFGNVEATGKRQVIAIDASGSMSAYGSAAWDDQGVQGIPGFTPLHCAAALALVAASTGDPCSFIAFGTSVHRVDVSPRRRLDDVVREIGQYRMGGTDLALPMLNQLGEIDGPVDAFQILTDNETWAGDAHPAQALVRYREQTGRPDVRLVTQGLISNGFTIADPTDPLQLDVVGMDASVPQVVSDFVAGRI